MIKDTLLNYSSADEMKSGSLFFDSIQVLKLACMIKDYVILNHFYINTATIWIATLYRNNTSALFYTPAATSSL